MAGVMAGTVRARFSGWVTLEWVSASFGGAELPRKRTQGAKPVGTVFVQLLVDSPLWWGHRAVWAEAGAAARDLRRAEFLHGWFILCLHRWKTGCAGSKGIISHVPETGVYQAEACSSFHPVQLNAVSVLRFCFSNSNTEDDVLLFKMYLWNIDVWSHHLAYQLGLPLAGSMIVWKTPAATGSGLRDGSQCQNPGPGHLLLQAVLHLLPQLPRHLSTLTYAALAAGWLLPFQALLEVPDRKRRKFFSSEKWRKLHPVKFHLYFFALMKVTWHNDATENNLIVNLRGEVKISYIRFPVAAI